MEHISFLDYDRITDQVVILTNSIRLSFTITLSKKDRTGARRVFYYETEYPSKYIGTETARSIKRNMDYYFTLGTNDFGGSMLIKPHDAYFLTKSLDKKVIPWFFGENRIFSIVDNTLRITGKFQPFIYQPYKTQYMKLNPIVLEQQDGFKEGLRIEINDPSIYGDIEIDKFFDMYYIISTTDMYGAACSMLNFVKMTPHGENIFKRVGLGGGYDPNDGWNNNVSNNKSRKNDFLDKK